MAGGEAMLEATRYSEHTMSIAFLLRAPGGMVPHCSDPTGWNQGVPNCPGGHSLPGIGACVRAGGPRG